LPSLALPDGSHNFEKDTAYFHLPDLKDPRKTVFGISCFRQMDASKLVMRSADITRGTVQKSVCVLSRLPLYGQIQVKMSLITEAYFREGDFSKRELVHQTYDNLNACLSDDMLHSQQLYVGLSARDFVRTFRQRSLVLFKLLLLESKVLFYQSPVSELCSALLMLLSLHPGMLENGLGEAARIVPPDTPPCASPCEEKEEPFAKEDIKEEVKEQHDTKEHINEQATQEDQQEDKNVLEEAEEAVEEGQGDHEHLKEPKFNKATKLQDKGEKIQEAEDDASSVTSSASIVDLAAEKVTDLKGRLSGALGYISSLSGRVAPAEEAKENEVYNTVLLFIV